MPSFRNHTRTRFSFFGFLSGCFVCRYLKISG
nr:MAG TPA: hypothetical protein [Caudoviricetes sp.]